MKASPAEEPRRGRPKNPDNEKKITRREDEVLQELKKGDSYSDIALTLAISRATVKKHATNAYQKLGVHSRFKAVNKYFPNA